MDKLNSNFIKNDDYAPIVLIAYNRPEHLKKTIHALTNNRCAKKSKLYCYIDGPKNKEDYLKQKKIIKEINKHNTKFKKISIICRKENFGLAKNITEAVTEVVKKYGKVIVLEDDVITSKAFLKFMNDALKFYEFEDRVWHIAGHTELNITQRKNEIFLWRLMNCWGWATWKSKWKFYKKDADLLIKEFNEQMIKDFDLDGSNMFWNQVIANAQNKINTWAIFWYATIFKNNGLCVNPYYSYTKNIGFDGTGVHCDLNPERIKKQPLNHYGKFIGKTEIDEDLEAFSYMRKAYFFTKKRSFFTSKLEILFKLKKLFNKFKKNIVKR